MIRTSLACVAAVVVATLVPTVAHQPASAAVRVDRDPQVLAVSLDGLNPTALRRLGHRGAPHLWRLVDEGASTLNARADVEQTVTLPNHTSMVTGRRIDRARGGHGVTWNDDRPRPSTVQRAAGHRVASVFSEVDRAGGSAALFSTKTKFAIFDRSWPAGIDRLVIREDDDAAVTRLARADLVAHDRAFTFLHLGAADKAGHAHGWLSPAYLRAVRRLDRLVGTIVAAARREPALADLTIILTADHGGPPGATDHSDATRLADYRIPFAVWGPGIGHHDLYAINPGYRSPGRGRPGYAGRQPVRNADVANLALRLLHDPAVPGSQFGRVRPLRVR